MGILNVTPDSFSDGGRFVDLPAALTRAEVMIGEGADIIDVGGESTRPGADVVPEDVERARVVPVIESLRSSGVRLSVDTTKPTVARAAAVAGATILNDVSASLEAVAAECGVGWIAMHRRGDPKVMQRNPRYDDVVSEVGCFLDEAAERGRLAGVRELWVDPGIGFGKTSAHNLALLAHLDALVGRGNPVCVGVSRKRFLGELLAASDGVAEPVAVEDRREASLAAATSALAAGAAVVRVHDVRMTVQALAVVSASRFGSTA